MVKKTTEPLEPINKDLITIDFGNGNKVKIFMSHFSKVLIIRYVKNNRYCEVRKLLSLRETFQSLRRKISDDRTYHMEDSEESKSLGK